MIDFIKYMLKILAVTALPALLYWWWEYHCTARQREKYKAWFWMSIIFGVLARAVISLIITGSLQIGVWPSYPSPYY